MREIEINLELAIQEGTSMGGLYMTLYLINATGGQRGSKKDR